MCPPGGGWEEGGEPCTSDQGPCVVVEETGGAMDRESCQDRGRHEAGRDQQRGAVDEAPEIADQDREYEQVREGPGRSLGVEEPRELKFAGGCRACAGGLLGVGFG